MVRDLHIVLVDFISNLDVSHARICTRVDCNAVPAIFMVFPSMQFPLYFASLTDIVLYLRYMWVLLIVYILIMLIPDHA